MGEYQFDLAKRFSEEFVRAIDVSPDKNHVAVLHFNQDTYLDFDFKSHASSEAAAAGIREVTYSPGAVSVDQALGFARDHVFVSEAGMRPREEAPVKILVAFTDGFIPLDAEPIGPVLEPFEVREKRKINKLTMVCRCVDSYLP